MTMALFDYTMSPELIKGWIKKVRPFLKCEDPAKREFDATIRDAQEKFLDSQPADVEIDEPTTSIPRILPFEFLYLICNAEPRMELMKQLKIKKTGVIKEKLSEFLDGEERRPDLEQLYPFDIKGNSKRHNPREQLLEHHAFEARDTKIVINDMRNLFKDLLKVGKES